MADDSTSRRAQRFRNPSATDPTGRRLLDAALTLARKRERSFHDLRLVDAVEAAVAADPEAPLTKGAAYTRFSSQPRFLRAVLAWLVTQEWASNRRKGS